MLEITSDARQKALMYIITLIHVHEMWKLNTIVNISDYTIIPKKKATVTGGPVG